MLRERLRRHEAISAYSYTFSPDPVPAVAAYVAPVGEIQELCSNRPPGSACVVLAYGPPELLRAAFALDCDDYLRDPWSPAEMEARLDRALRRRRGELPFGDGTYTLKGAVLGCPDGSAVRLGGPESAILRTLVRNSGEIVTREALCLAVWGHQLNRPSRALDVHVSALRRKMGRNLIRCVRGKGYVLS